jgi:hypothetical protein
MSSAGATKWAFWSLLWLPLLSAPASSQAVTFAELDGALVETLVVHQQVIRREGREFPVRLESDLTLLIGPGDQIQRTWTPTSHTPRGKIQGKPQTNLIKLERTRELGSLGGGHGVVVFSDGTLTFLRTLKGGALKRDVAFARGAEALTCTATEAFVRESGVGAIFFDSSIDGVPMIVVSAKQLSSTCRVTAGKAATAQ